MASIHDMEMEPKFEEMTVKELRKYLRERNQKVTGVKVELVVRAKGAHSLRLSSVPIDVEVARTIPFPKTRELVAPNGFCMPNPKTLNCGLSDDVDLLPEFTEKEAYNYLVLSTHRTNDSKPMQAKRQLKAAIFYEDRHVHSISIHSIDEECDHMFVKCLVIPSFPTADIKNSPDHDVWVCLSKVTGHVHSAYCTCAAGAGEACNHISALLYALVDISQKKADGLLSCTSVECKWKIPRKRKLAPAKSDDLNLMSSGRKSIMKKKRDEQSVTTRPSTDSSITDESVLISKCPNSNMPDTKININRFRNNLISNRTKGKCGWIVNTTPLSELSQNCVKQLPELPNVDYCFCDSVDLNSDSCQKTFSDYFESIKVTKEEAATTECLTRGQHKSDAWKEARSGRITSSQFGKIQCRKATTAPDKLVHNFMGYGKEFSNEHTRWGISHEPAARRQYAKVMSDSHSQLTVAQCGLIVNPQFPYLAASPDGLVSCTGCDKCDTLYGLVEIKCPSVYRNLTPEEAASQKDFFCSLDEHNLVKLKESDHYYFQVQGQMAITNRKWCDFVVWTLKGISIQRIHFNQAKWHEMVVKLQRFYLSAMIPEMFSRRVKRGMSLYSRTPK